MHARRNTGDVKVGKINRKKSQADCLVHAPSYIKNRVSYKGVFYGNNVFWMVCPVCNALPLSLFVTVMELAPG